MGCAVFLVKNSKFRTWGQLSAPRPLLSPFYPFSKRTRVDLAVFRGLQEAGISTASCLCGPAKVSECRYVERGIKNAAGGGKGAALEQPLHMRVCSAWKLLAWWHFLHNFGCDVMINNFHVTSLLHQSQKGNLKWPCYELGVEEQNHLRQKN